VRYYEKIAAEKARRERLAGPPPTLAEKAISTGYLIAAVFIAIFLLNLLAPRLEPYARPLYDSYVVPVVENKLVPWYNDRFVPWWDSAAPVLQRQLQAFSRRLI